jgi:hypothetical protein
MLRRAVAGDPTGELAWPDDRQAARQAPTEETIMEMSWMETFQLLGLDVIALILMALALANVVEHAMHAAWETARARKPRSPKAAVAPRARIGGVKHV